MRGRHCRRPLAIKKRTLAQKSYATASIRESSSKLPKAAGRSREGGWAGTPSAGLAYQMKPSAGSRTQRGSARGVGGAGRCQRRGVAMRRAQVPDGARVDVASHFASGQRLFAYAAGAARMSTRHSGRGYQQSLAGRQREREGEREKERERGRGSAGYCDCVCTAHFWSIK